MWGVAAFFPARKLRDLGGEFRPSTRPESKRNWEADIVKFRHIYLFKGIILKELSPLVYRARQARRELRFRLFKLGR